MTPEAGGRGNSRKGLQAKGHGRPLGAAKGKEMGSPGIL